MRKKWFLSAAFMFILFLFPIKANADMGPKPSIVIHFTGLEEENYYVTLLSERDSTGPWSCGDDYYDYLGDESVFKKFSEYEDEDGYYFLSFMEDCSEDDTFQWTYYPPDKFKILIYFPQYDLFAKSEDAYERYAFDSYFTVDVSDITDAELSVTEEIRESDELTIEARESYDFTMEIQSMIIRIVLTIAIEILIALIFGYRDRKSLSMIAMTNLFTQILLNVLLNIINYQSGQYAFVFHYVWMEMAVFVIEAMIYSRFIDKRNRKTGKILHPVWYAAVANMTSFAVGIWIAKAIPGIF